MFTEMHLHAKSIPTYMRGTYVTEFWKITHIAVPETIGIFDITMVLRIIQNPSQIFLKIFL